MMNLLNWKKKKEPLPKKSKEEMPYAQEGLSFKQWRNKNKKTHKWYFVRWSVLLGINGLFILSFALDLSMLEGSLSGSRLIGFYLMDPFNSLQTILVSLSTGYFPHLTMNFWIGVFTILLFYGLVGGRTFCSWLCPYHFLAELGEMIHNYLVKKKKIKSRHFKIGSRWIYWIGFIILALATQNLVFEDLNPVGILSRSMIYGPGLILLWIFALIILEILYSKRFWCRYVCPIGTTYSLVGKVTPLTVKFEYDKCAHCTDCMDDCLVPHELWFVKRGKATDNIHYVGSDCTRCGKCIDACPANALSFTYRGIDKLT